MCKVDSNASTWNGVFAIAVMRWRWAVATLAVLQVSGGCCVPGVEVYRKSANVVVTASPGLKLRAVACTWSKWHQFKDGCEDVADGVWQDERWFIEQWDSGGPFVLILGEAPLMQTLYVACDASVPVGATFVKWDEEKPENVAITQASVGVEVLREEGWGMTQGDFQRKLDDICDGRGLTEPDSSGR